jgi:hypothetical protein
VEIWICGKVRWMVLKLDAVNDKLTVGCCETDGGGSGI